MIKKLQLSILGILALVAAVGAGRGAPLLAAPRKPSLKSPAKGAVVIIDKAAHSMPDLKWTDATNVANISSYDIEVATEAGFSPGSIVLSDTVAPVAGTNVYNIFTDGGVDLDYGKTYYWHVQAYGLPPGSEPSGWSATFRFYTALEPPTLTAPADGSVVETLRPTFQWDAVTGAEGYNLQVSKNTLFNNLLLNVNLSSAATSFSPKNDLPNNSVLYWRMRTKHSTYGPGGWTTPRSFITGDPPTIPSPQKPRNNKLTDDYTPLLLWSTVTVPSGLDLAYYHVQIDDTSKAFGSLVVDDTSVTNRLQPWIDVGTALPGGLDPAHTYYWRVRACDTPDGGATFYCSAWSKAFALRTTVERPVLLTPGQSESSPPPIPVETDSTPTFDWNDVPFAARYTVQISRQPNFRKIWRVVHTTNSEFTPSKPLPRDTTLYWRVRAEKVRYGPGPWSATWVFQSANPPRTPVLKKPAARSLVTTYTPQFRWSVSRVYGSTSFGYYLIQIAKDSTFTTVDIDDNSNTDQYAPQFVPGAPLDPASRYYWRVLACTTPDGGATYHCSPWSKVRSFKTAVEPPTLVTYGGGALTLPLDWNDVTGATGYMIQISRTPNFKQIVRQANTTVSEYNPGKPLPGGTYYWRVRTKNNAFGPSAWSAVDSFTVP